MGILINESNVIKNTKLIEMKISGSNGDIKNVISVYSNINSPELKTTLVWKSDHIEEKYGGYSVLTGYNTSVNYSKYFEKDNFSVLGNISLGGTIGKTTFIKKIDNYIFMNVGGTVFRSSDGGKTFTTVLSINNSFADTMSIASGNNTIIIEYNDSNNGNIIYYSKNMGTTWTYKKIYNVNIFGNVIFGNGKFIYYSSYTGSTYRGIYHLSDDGINWTEHNISTTFSPWWIGFGNNTYVGVGGLNGTNTPICCYSVDGINWVVSSTNSFTSSSIFIGYINGKYYAVNDDLSKVFYSNDGKSWSNTSMTISPKPTKILDISYSKENNKFYLVSSDKIYSSNDAITWTGVFNLPQTFTNSKLFIY